MIAAILKALPTLLALIQQIVGWARERNLIEKGRLIAIAEAAQSLNTELAKAAAAEQEAAAKHASDPTDNAFDSEFRRD